MTTPLEDLNRVRQHADQLAEHFDSVQIFVTRHEAGEADGTVNLHYGAGNFFARYGQVETWLTKTREATRLSIIEENKE